jgi:transposase
MPWTEATRRQYRRDELRYASDMTDAEWALIAPHLPPPRRLGRPRTTELRAVVDGLLYILATGCQWRLLPKDFPPYSTVQRFFYQWRGRPKGGRRAHRRA